VRLDGDTYEATWLALMSLYPGLSTGGYVIVDDYHAMPECGQAVDDFRRRHDITEPLEEVDWTCLRWRRERDAQIDPSAQPPARDEPAGNDRVRPVARAGDTRVPTERELELTNEVTELRERVVAAQAEIDRLQRAPAPGVRAALRRRLRAWRGSS
jgi:uncharacterized small protein (DUF1192 family)